MLINVQDVDLSNVSCCFDVLVEIFYKTVISWKKEKVTWNNIDSDSCIFPDGYNVTTSSSSELVMDDSAFQSDSEEEKNCPIGKNISENGVSMSAVLSFFAQRSTLISERIFVKRLVIK